MQRRTPRKIKGKQLIAILIVVAATCIFGLIFRV